MRLVGKFVPAAVAAALLAACGNASVSHSSPRDLVAARSAINASFGKSFEGIYDVTAEGHGESAHYRMLYAQLGPADRLKVFPAVPGWSNEAKAFYMAAGKKTVYCLAEQEFALTSETSCRQVPSVDDYLLSDPPPYPIPFWNSVAARPGSSVTASHRRAAGQLLDCTTLASPGSTAATKLTACFTATGVLGYYEAQAPDLPHLRYEAVSIGGQPPVSLFSPHQPVATCSSC